MTPDSDDATLVESYLASNQDALGGLYDRHAPAVFRYLATMIGSSDAPDALQETFIKAASSLGAYEDRGRFRQWLLCIARRKALDMVRARKRKPHRALAEGEEESLSGTEPPPYEVQHRKELAERIREAVESLPEKQRSVFVLREESGLSFKEIGEILEIPVNTALSHMHRALTGLRHSLADLESVVP